MDHPQKLFIIPFLILAIYCLQPATAFRYDGRSVVNADIISAPGCPKPDDGNPWVKYRNSAQCYLTGTEGPCREEQTLAVTKGSLSGFCMCDCLWEDFTTKPLTQQDMFCKSKKYYNVEYVFNARHKSCYKIYDQGPCKDGEWLVKIGSGTRCQKRFCPLGRIPVFENGTHFCGKPLYRRTWARTLGGWECGKGERWSSRQRRCIKVLRFDF